MASATLDGNILENLENLSDSKEGNIIQLPIPTLDDSSTELFDLLGATTIITVSGYFQGDTIAAVKAKVDIIKNILDGDQSSTVEFISDPTGSIDVMIGSAMFDWDVPGFRCSYTIKLLKGVNI